MLPNMMDDESYWIYSLGVSSLNSLSHSLTKLVSDCLLWSIALFVVLALVALFAAISLLVLVLLPLLLRRLSASCWLEAV